MRQKQDVFLSVFAVALLAEGVDRNIRPMLCCDIDRKEDLYENHDAR